MHALVIGAGLAGSATAIALRKAGLDVTLVEAHDAPTGQGPGAFLTVATNGLDALAAIDAQDVVADGFVTATMRFVSGATGRSLGAVPLGPVDGRAGGPRTVRRADLHAALLDLAVRRGADVRHGAGLVDARGAGRRVVARLADGSTLEGDVLVGADGVRSTVRRVIDPAAPAPRYVGLANAGGWTRDVPVEAPVGDYVAVVGREVFHAYVVAPDGEVWWFANPPEPRERDRAELAAGRATLHEDLVRRLAPDRSPGAALVRATGPVAWSNQYELAHVPVWHRDRMVLVGDAAHAAQPSSGQGASMAFEDAVVLARALRDAPSVDAALAAYVGARRARVERVVRLGARSGQVKTLGPVGRVVRDALMPAFLRLAAHPRVLARQAWLHAHHLEWDDVTVPAG